MLAWHPVAQSRLRYNAERADVQSRTDGPCAGDWRTTQRGLFVNARMVRREGIEPSTY